jgi:citrate lyase subunit beta / citryl-CoA lyase
MSSALAAARSLLFVPGNRPERFEKALASGADAIVLDLEDSVPEAGKVAARAAVAAAWPGLLHFGVPLLVRINASGSASWSDDLKAMGTLPALAGVMVSKAESTRSLRQISDAVGTVPLLPLIETAAGLDAVKALGAVRGVLRLVVGHLDFMADTGIVCDEDEAELLPLRFAIAMATRLHGLAPAIDGVTVQVDDEQRLRNDTLRARRLGFGAKLCIHPRQVAMVHDSLAPSPVELEWARRVVEADLQSEGAAVQLDGRMVDAPVVLQARRWLARASLA